MDARVSVSKDTISKAENKTIVSIYHGETTVAIEGIGGDDLVAVIKAITN